MKKKNAPRPVQMNTRKLLRKQKRLEKKVHRQEYYSKRSNPQEKLTKTPGMFVKRPADDTELNATVKKKKHNHPTSPFDILSKEQQKDKKETNRLKRDMDEQRRKMLVKANEDEDKIIKKLEKQLGLNKSKNKNNYFTDDGLDYLLEICDRSTTEQIVAAEKHLADVEAESDFEDDLAAVTGKDITKEQNNKKKSHTPKKDANSEDELVHSSKEDNVKDENEFMGESDIDNDFLSDVDESDDELSQDNDEINEEFLYDDGISDEDGSDSEDAPDEKPFKSTKRDQNTNKKLKSDEPISKKAKLEQNKTSIKERVILEEDLSKVFSDDEVSHLSSDDEDLNDFPSDKGDEDTQKEEKPDVWEDIYGRKRDKEGNIIKEEKGTYIPPHLRNKDSTSDKDLFQLKRQIKSVLNKLTGSNLHWACTSIENLYNSHSRHSVNSALNELWNNACSSNITTPKRLLAEHAALVAVLHANVAEEIGAHFLQELVTRFDELMLEVQPIEDKTLDNIVACLSQLYNFKIYHASLLYDILNRLMDEITEKNIECVLVCLRNVGGVLRKEEPLALKTFIQETQAKVSKLSDSAATGSRIKFLLEVLLAVKNNNLNKIPDYDPTYTDQLKKSIKTIIRKGNYITPLNIRLEDLLKADERGKWWIVGSAWEGKQDRREEQTKTKLPSTDERLLRLARAQRMNTDVRRSIFCVIMAAEDYMDAFEKLQHLGLKGQQEREIVHVLLACCLQEKTYNPYYAVLAQKLCDFDRKYQLSIQYSVWDKIKDIEGLLKHSLTNLAQLLTHLIMEKGLPLSILKIIQFSDLNKSSVRFMRQILLSIIMNADLQASLEVFHRISKPPKLHMFRESLKLFIQHFLIKNAGKKNVLSEEEMVMLKNRAVEVDKILTMFDSKVKF